MKATLIFIQVAAVILLLLHFFNFITNRYIPVICYSIIFISLIVTLIRHKYQQKKEYT